MNHHERELHRAGGGIAGLLRPLGFIAVVTAPLWLPVLLGFKPKYCKCGVRLGPSGICPSCSCEY